jgi:DNA polymerase/3'-5' exonuclease PolX
MIFQRAEFDEIDLLEKDLLAASIEYSRLFGGKSAQEIQKLVKFLRLTAERRSLRGH